MKKILLFGICIILLIPLVNAKEIFECKGAIDPEESPCLILLPNNNTLTACNTITLTVSNETQTLYSQTLSEYTTYMCNGTFNQTSVGTYTFVYSTKDTGSIIIKESDSMNVALAFLFSGFGGLLIALGIFVLLRSVKESKDDNSY